MKKRCLMRKIIITVCFILTGVCENLWGASGEYSDGSFVEISDPTRNLLKGYIRCGSLMKSLVPTKDTPILMWVKIIGSYSIDIAEKVDQVRGFLDGFVQIGGEEFSMECCLANPTLKLSPARSNEILAWLRRDLEVWLMKHEMFRR
jgi:hypothetical protein